MAVLIPSRMPSDATAGERRFFHLLEKLPSSFTGWMNPMLGDDSPDFVVYAPKNGLIVLEVKDWSLDHVVSADRQTVLFRTGWDVTRRTSPLGQSLMYLNRMKSLFQRPGGKFFLLPLHCGIIFPNITRADYLRRLRQDASISGLARPETTLFQDDLENIEQSSDKGNAFQSFLNEHFPSLFAWEPSSVLNTVKQKLGSSVIVEMPAPSWESGEKRLVALDEEQENEALRLSGGRRLLKGAAGSGKTLVLTSRAAALVRRGQCRRVLFLCFNLCLAGYIRRLLSARAVPLGPEGVEVMPVYALAARILGDRIEESQNGEYYETIQTLALEELETGLSSVIGLWDAVFVDEAQDFSAAMVRMVERILRPETPLLAAMDADQHLYASSCPEAWQNIRGMKTSMLKKRYRCTRQIMAFAEDWLGGNAFVDDEELGVNQGEMPRVLHASSLREAAALAAEETARMRRLGMRQGDMAVLYARDRNKGQTTRLSTLLAEKLAAKGLMSQWPVEDDRAKLRYDSTTDSVVISTIHSMKGMDFAHVTLILPLSMAEGRAQSLLGTMNGRRASWEAHHASPVSDPQRHALVYVGMTRARQSLTVIWHDDGISEP
ncbi:nuclease-related domain-containing DEAD/DEAH box helicase [uncultured Mailhella sp.]|uniref:nuclease-related domain-containing DEAD/DEAH box helicase n=1 Tax=uncultured Mailhella sp. TaxID=1981031 RepID=UPI0025F8A972|nr:UvrD-helicase domain-containing protein [uncultured Mailhella sp.]